MPSYATLLLQNPHAFPALFDALYEYAQHLANGAQLFIETPASPVPTTASNVQGIGWSGNGNSYWGGFWWWLADGSWRGVYLVYQWQAAPPGNEGARTYTESTRGFYGAYITEDSGVANDDTGQIRVSRSIQAFAAHLQGFPAPLGS
jgi:hypothetical protein